MVECPYKGGLIPEKIYSKRVPVKASFIAISDTKLNQRGLELIDPRSRAVSKGIIMEMIVTDEETACAGGIVNRIIVLGFVEALNGGLVRVGDRVTMGNKILGEVVGFDETHAPNHTNFILKSEKPLTGREHGLNLLDEILFTPPPESGEE